MEVLMAGMCTVAALVMMVVAKVASMEQPAQIVLIVTGMILLISSVMFALKMEQDAGYYVCKSCNHYYQPSYMSVLWAPHSGRTRYMKCPKCGKRSWQKKKVTCE